MLTFTKARLYPMWKLHSGKGKDEVENLLKYIDTKKNPSLVLHIITRQLDNGLQYIG